MFVVRRNAFGDIGHAQHLISPRSTFSALSKAGLNIEQCPGVLVTVSSAVRGAHVALAYDMLQAFTALKG